MMTNKMTNNNFCDIDGSKERGVNFCPTNGNIELSDICIGEKCNIPSRTESEIECKCKTTPIGKLHTHPGLGIKYGEISDVMHSC